MRAATSALNESGIATVPPNPVDAASGGVACPGMGLPAQADSSAMKARNKGATQQVHAESIEVDGVEILTQQRRPVPALRVSAVHLSIIEDNGHDPTLDPGVSGSSSAHVRRNRNE